MLSKMAKLKELFLVRANENRCSDVVDEPHVTELSPDLASSVSTGATNEFYYDEDFAIPFDANLTDVQHQAAPAEDSVLLCSTPDGASSTDHWSADETSLSPYRTVIDLSDSDAEIDDGVEEIGNASGGEYANYSDADSRLLRGCEVSVENEQLSVDMERSLEDLNRSSDSLAEKEVDCDKPEVRMYTWAEIGKGSVKGVSEKPEVYDTDEIDRSNTSQPLVHYESSHLVTWAGLSKRNSNYAVALEDGPKMDRESSPVFMHNRGSQLALTTGFVSTDVSQVAKGNKFSQRPVPLAVGMTTWKILATPGLHDDSCSCSDGSSAEELRSFGETKSLPLPRREESVSSPSSKDDGYDSVTKDPSMCDSQNAFESDSIQSQFEGSNGGKGGSKWSSPSEVEVPDIFRQVLGESQLCSSRSATDDRTRGVPCRPSDNSRMAKALEDQKQPTETADFLFQSRGLQGKKCTTFADRQDSLDSSTSSSGQESVMFPVSHFAEALTRRSPSEPLAKLSPTHENETEQDEEALAKFSKRKWNDVANTEDNSSFGLYSLLRPLPDLSFLRKTSLKDKSDRKSLRICSETKAEFVDSVRKQFVFGYDSSRSSLCQNTLECDSNEYSLEKETLSESGNRGGSFQFSPIPSRIRSSSSDSAFNAHSSTSSGIDPGNASPENADLDDGYGTWSKRKSTLKTQIQLAKTRNSVALQTPETKRVWKNCEGSDLSGGGSRDFDKRERLVVKVCNTCNVRTVLLGEGKQTSQRSLSFLCGSNTKNQFTLPPKSIISSANDTSNKNTAFDKVVFSENLRHMDSAFHARDSTENNSSDDITLEPIKPNENTNIMSNALDIVDSSEDYHRDNKEPLKQNFKTFSISEDRVRTNTWSSVDDKCGSNALANYDKNRKAIDGKEIRQQLMNCSSSSTAEQQFEVNEQCSKLIGPKTAFAEFLQEKCNALWQVEKHSNREIELQLPRANKNVSILENGVLFRPGSGIKASASQRNGSKAVRITSHDQEKLEEDVIACVWKSAANFDHKESLVEDEPPVDFVISSDTEYSHDSMDELTKKTDLILNTMRSVEILLNHFNRNRSSKGHVGDTRSDGQVGHLVLDHLCPALQEILLDGLKPELRVFFGYVRNSIRQVIEDSATLDHPPNLLKDVMASLKSLKFLNTPTLFFNAFVFALLNCKALDFWLSYVRSHASLLQKHYASASFLHLSHSTAFRAFQDLVAFLRPLALLPFRLEYNFEVKIQERRLEECRARRALERHLVSADVCLGLVEIQQNYSNDKLLEYSRKSAEVRNFVEKAELDSKSLDKTQQCASTEAKNKVGSNQRPFFAFKRQIEDDNNKDGLIERPQMTSKLSPEVVGVQAIVPIELAAEPRAVAISRRVNGIPSHQNSQRKSQIQSTVCPDKQINCKKPENQVPCQKAPSAVFTPQSNPTITAARTIWSECSQRLGLVKNRLEELLFGSS